MKVNIKKIVYLAAFSCVVMLLLINWFQKKTLENEEAFLDSYLEFNHYNKIHDTPLVYEVFKDTEKIGYLIFESEYGYQSDVTIATLIGMDQTILDAKTYAQEETPAFYNKIIAGKFFKNNFVDSKTDMEFEVGTTVDAISRATISSTAITKAVQKGVSFVNNKYFGVHLEISQEKLKIGEVEIGLIILFLIVILAYKTKNKKLRYLAMIYSIIILGFRFKQFISYSWFISMLTLKVPSIPSNMKWYILVGGALGLIVITGKNLYCAYICPFGALQEMEYRLAKFQFFKVNPKLRKLLSIIPGVVAYLAFVLALTSKQLGATSYEPFSLIFGQSGVDIQWILLPIVVIFSLFVMRFYCNFGCPVGFALGLVQRLRQKVVKLWTKTRNKPKEKHSVKPRTKPKAS